MAIAQERSEENLSVVVDKVYENKALNALHEGFFLSDTKVINLFVVGTGLIGSTLLKQIKEQKESLLSDRGVEIRVIGLANSKKRSEEHTSELQSRGHLVCRLLLEKKK